MEFRVDPMKEEMRLSPFHIDRCYLVEAMNMRSLKDASVFFLKTYLMDTWTENRD